MSTFGYTFDATGVSTDDFPPLPSGAYVVRMIDSDLRVTKDGNGKYLRAVLQVIDGEYAERKIFDNINLENQNETAVEIGHRRLSQICHAVNMLQVRDSAELHDKPMLVDVGIEPAKGEYAERNKVLKYRPRVAPSPQKNTSPLTGKSGTAPWKK